MDRTERDLDDGVQQLLARIKDGEPIRPEQNKSADAATRDGFVERDPNGNLALTARGRHLVES